ncbi:hypothetical protein EDC63_101490 [Sulfurirhabdus autotrophica]|uniref:Uncharacterized protein n=1 Tax=Sulfurirhabdus autotrophica TaxID=1706046 RepID=A0A4R3YED3_9PROT|nr:hypothetical protein EDC63_101490 [Sulfurirhabdus autotrophica]
MIVKNLGSLLKIYLWGSFEYLSTVFDTFETTQLSQIRLKHRTVIAKRKARLSIEPFSLHKQRAKNFIVFYPPSTSNQHNVIHLPAR